MKIKFMQALLGLMLMAPAAASAATDDGASVDMLVLRMANETTAEFKLDDTPTVTFEDGQLLVTSASATGSYAQSDVTEFYFKKYDPTTGVGKVAGGNFSFVYDNNSDIVISGTKAAKATLYTVDGKLVKVQNVSGGNATVSVADCQPGIYVLSLENEHTFKIIKK